MTGWRQPPVARRSAQPKCPHLGVVVAALSVYLHDVGHEWECVCGKVFVVVSDGEKKWLAPRRRS